MKSNKKKASAVPGKKYLLVTADGLYGPTILYADAINRFPSLERDRVKTREAAIWRAHGDKIFRVVWGKK